MAETLIDIRQKLGTNGEVVKFRMVDRFLNGSESKVLPRLYFITNPNFSYQYVEMNGGGGVSFRALNTSYADSDLPPDSRKTEPMSVFGGPVRTDYVMIDVKGDAARQDQIDKRMMTAGKLFDKIFFHGNPALPVAEGGRGNEMRGLRVRATGTQLLSPGVNGGQLTLNLLDRALDRVVGDNANKVIQCGRAHRRQISALLRGQGNVNYTMDADRQVTKYDNATIDVIDEDESYNEIFQFNETWGASNLTSSIYVTRFGKSDDESFVQGLIGSKFMVLRPPANLGTHVLEVAESLMGLGTFHQRSFARIAGLLTPDTEQ